jgi:glutaredoxin 3
VIEDRMVEVYSKNGCAWCDKLTGYLVERGIPHTVVKADWSPDTLREFQEKFPGARTVPQVMVDGKWIGGYHESIAWFNDKYERA